MKRPPVLLAALVAGLLAAPYAVAQTQPSSGSLHQPTPAERAAASAPVTPPAPAPRSAVQQVAPFTAPMPTPSTLGHSAPGRAAGPKHTPVVQPPPHGHAQKAPPPTGKAATGKAAAGAAAGAAAAAAAKEVAKPAETPPAEAARPADQTKGSVTGMPLPRWASLRSDEVNMRTGPGTRYPIEWVYRRRDLPVQIEREFEVWRLIEDQDGVKGWVHQATLTGRRSFVVKGAERVLQRSASEDSSPVARLKPGVVGRIRSCDPKATWCDVQVNDYRGWLKRDDVYGVYQGEAVN